MERKVLPAKDIKVNRRHNKNSLSRPGQFAFKFHLPVAISTRCGQAGVRLNKPLYKRVKNLLIRKPFLFVIFFWSRQVRLRQVPLYYEVIMMPNIEVVCSNHIRSMTVFFLILPVLDMQGLDF
jgi:hypothetical protein